MAITLLLTKTRAKIGTLTLDASISESHTAEVEVTDSPVEKGAAISDHARPRPDTVTIEGLVTNSPIPTSANESVPHSFAQGDRLIEWSSKGVSDQALAINAYETLREIKNKGEIVTVVTALRVYEDVVMTSLSVPRDAKVGQALRFSATFRQIKLVSNQTVKITRVTETKAKPKSNLGTKPAKPAEAPKKASIFARISHMLSETPVGSSQ